MDTSALPLLLGLATLLPLASFFVILIGGRRFGRAFGHGAYIAVGAIGTAAVLSFCRWPSGSRIIFLSRRTTGTRRHKLPQCPAAQAAVPCRPRMHPTWTFR